VQKEKQLLKQTYMRRPLNRETGYVLG